MRDWYEGLAERERRALLLGVFAVAGALLYVLLLAPMHEALGRARLQLAAAQELNGWMQRAAAQAAAMRATAGPAGKRDHSQSLLAVIDSSTRAAGIEGAVKRLNPESDTQARLSLEHVSFDALLKWLIGLAREHAVEVSRISVEREDQPGMARASLTLQLPRGGK